MPVHMADLQIIAAAALWAIPATAIVFFGVLSLLSNYGPVVIDHIWPVLRAMRGITQPAKRVLVEISQAAIVASGCCTVKMAIVPHLPHTRDHLADRFYHLVKEQPTQADACIAALVGYTVITITSVYIVEAAATGVVPTSWSAIAALRPFSGIRSVMSACDSACRWWTSRPSILGLYHRIVDGSSEDRLRPTTPTSYHADEAKEDPEELASHHANFAPLLTPSTPMKLSPTRAPREKNPW